VVAIDFTGPLNGSRGSYGGKVSVLTAAHLGTQPAPALTSPCVIGIDSNFNGGPINIENLLLLDGTSTVLILNSANQYQTPSTLRTFWASYIYSPGTASTTVSQP
jgi:hypothetical protein